MSDAQGSTDEEGLGLIESVGACYNPGDGGPLTTIAVKRSPAGIFECPSCLLCETDTVEMQVSPRAVH